MQHSTSSNDPVFAIYDIIALICANINESDLVGLLTVSRGFFRCATPHIWRRVPDAQPLLDLIPTEHRDAESFIQSTHILDEKSRLSRFDFYALFVKELCLQPQNHEELNWHSLSKAVPRRPLLPDLCKLILDAPSAYYFWEYSFGGSQDLVPLNAFICPSLVDIRLPSLPLFWLNPGIASQLLENIVDTAPDLRVLHIYVRADVGSAASALDIITRFRNLRALKCTSVMIDCEKLQLLGDLPRLESLQVGSPGAPDDEDEVPAGDWVLLARSFPMLRHLSAYRLPNSRVDQFWRLTSLVQSLVSVSISFHPGSFSGKAVSGICKGSPQMLELSLNFPGYGDQEILDVAAIGHIRKLPLQRLRVVGSKIVDLAPLISSMTNLEYLEINQKILSTENLILIAKHMPKLKFLSPGHLSLDQLWDVMPHLVTPSPSALCLVTGFRFSECFMSCKKNITMEELLDAIAQYVCKLPEF
ncbi:hypothetical protein FRC06_004573 [Ceratobasidium sp. 370]|nr:hypothetical protein FRC06_004573 [Ceratobasidium sp. 370]